MRSFSMLNIFNFFFLGIFELLLILIDFYQKYEFPIMNKKNCKKKVFLRISTKYKSDRYKKNSKLSIKIRL